MIGTAGVLKRVEENKKKIAEAKELAQTHLKIYPFELFDVD